MPELNDGLTIVLSRENARGLLMDLFFLQNAALDENYEEFSDQFEDYQNTALGNLHNLLISNFNPEGESPF